MFRPPRVSYEMFLLSIHSSISIDSLTDFVLAVKHFSSLSWIYICIGFKCALYLLHITVALNYSIKCIDIH